MMKNEDYDVPISNILCQFKSSNIDSNDKLTLEEVFTMMHSNSNYFLILLVSAIAVIPAIHIFSGVILIFILMQIAIYDQSKVILPKRFLRIEIKRYHLSNAISKIYTGIKFTERIMKPRLRFLSSSKAGVVIFSSINVICSILMIIPLPFTNLIPSISIVVSSIGMLNKDGYVVMIGYVIAIIGMLISIVAIKIGWHIIAISLHTLLNVLLH